MLMDLWVCVWCIEGNQCKIAHLVFFHEGQSEHDFEPGRPGSKHLQYWVLLYLGTPATTGGFQNKGVKILIIKLHKNIWGYPKGP